MLDRIGAPREEANSAVFAASQLLDLRDMRPGDDVTAWLETDPGSGAVRLTGVSLRPEAERQVLVSRGLDGTWTPHELKAKMIARHQLHLRRRRSVDLPDRARPRRRDQQVVDYADIFGYDIDFQREVQRATISGCCTRRSRTSAAREVKTGNVSDGLDGWRGADEDVLPLTRRPMMARSTISTRPDRAPRNS